MRLKLNHLFEVKDNKIILNDVSFSITDNEFLSIVSEDEEILSTAVTVVVAGAVEVIVLVVVIVVVVEGGGGGGGGEGEGYDNDIVGVVVDVDDGEIL